MVKAKKVKSKVKAVDDAAENPFENPEAATVEGSTASLSVMKGNEIEAPEGDDELDGDARGDLRDKIKSMIKDADNLYWDLAHAIAEVANDKLYKKWGYSSFEAYVNEECRIDKRKGQYFVAIHNYFSTTLRTILIENTEIYEKYLEVAKKIGWVKARILSKEQVITPENAEVILEKVQSCTVRDLEGICAAAADEMSDADKEKRLDENVDKQVSFNFKTSLAQKADVEDAIQHALAIMPSGASRSSALSFVARAYKESEDVGRGAAPDVRLFLASLEERLGIKLIAIDPGAGKIVFGEDTLHQLGGTMAVANDADNEATA